MRIRLKKLFGNNESINPILKHLSDVSETPLQLHDANEKLLIQNSNDEQLTHRFPLTHEGEVLGWLSGDKRTQSIQPLLNFLIAEEASKKSMAEEVLNAYREITLLYNISEKLTASLKIRNVIQVALTEATRLIKTTSGVVVLNQQDPQDSPITTRFDQESSTPDIELLATQVLSQLDQHSKAEIVNDLHADSRFSESDYPFHSLLWAPLKSKQTILGIILIAHTREKTEYSARDLGLLNTIASQTAPAVEKATHYENLEHLVEERTRELSEAKDAAEAASRAKSQFLASMSHELRTPLNALLGYAQILKQEKDLSEKQVDGLDIIHRSGEHLLTLINDILDLSKIEAGKMELDIGEFSLDELLRNLSRLFQFRAIEKNITFEYHQLSPLPDFVRGDEIKIRQILINLLSNAIKFTDDGGVVLKVGKVDKNIRFEVDDTGIGIAKDHLREIFQSFRQISHKDKYMEGTGLGLAISHKLASMMNSELHVKSTPDKGSTFWFELPLSSVKTTKQETFTQQKKIIGYEGQRIKILVVEDRAENRSVLTNILTPLGFELIEAYNGKQGLEKAIEHHPDLVLMDLVMPVMDGFECMRRIRQTPSIQNTCIIALSASVFESDRKTTTEAGGDDFLPKPVRIDQLLEKFQHHLNIQWIYKTELLPELDQDDSSALLSPSVDELQDLFHAAKQGNILGIRREIDRIMHLDNDYLPFCNKLRKLAKNFNMKQICQFLEPYMSSHN